MKKRQAGIAPDEGSVHMSGASGAPGTSSTSGTSGASSAPGASGTSGLDGALHGVFLGAGTEFRGSLSARGQVRIEGRFSGKIESAGLVVLAEGSDVEADVVAGKAVLAGRFSGTLGAGAEVRLAPSAKVEAEIRSPAFSMEAGALFAGRVIKSRP